MDIRLKTCIEYVDGKGTVCDIGTDHAYLAAELINSGICSKVIASDINPKPLESAAKTIEKNGISDKVELILSDGLENIPLDGVSDIIIAGMGGETIADIIDRADSDDIRDIRFILQPMTKPEILRRRLYKYQMQIVSEKAVRDGSKTYLVMCAEYNSDFKYLTEAESYAGFFDDDDPMGREYREDESKRLETISLNLEKAGKHRQSVHYHALSCKVKNGWQSVRIKDIYDYLNELYPFDLQEKWDNSGVLTEGGEEECNTVILSLDITYPVICEADCKGADLIISHHPVIFNPIKKIEKFTPVYELVNRDISAICMHTNLDIAEGGTNGIILERLKNNFNVKNTEPFEEIGENCLGYIIELSEKISALDFGRKLKDIFGCEYIRMTNNNSPLIGRIAFCSGSGGSMLGLAIEKNCDALITGDVKHDVWINSINNGRITVFDCGHFHTENIVLEEIRRVLEEKFPNLDVEISENSTDPCVYI
ncbi:MAG: Nif3-like dinuclear metal center hexameric protein [Ruminococcus sp.]|nr:Nif3-like dinuclear metal center hexameric protein [Ruminococcus sp.]